MKIRSFIVLSLVIGAIFFGGNSFPEVKQPIPVTGFREDPILRPMKTLQGRAAIAVGSLFDVIEFSQTANLIPDTAAITTEEENIDQFIQSVSTGEAGLLTGVYVRGRFSLPVLQQPQGQAGYVSKQDDTVTQFAMPRAYGTVGLLAHNFLSGKRFFELQVDDEVTLVYGDGSQVEYRITQIDRYQALAPNDANSDFIDLSDVNQTKISASQLFQRVYTLGDRVVFQTCILANGDPSWGRIFVTAERT